MTHKTNPNESVRNMTIREHFVAAAMQGLISNGSTSIDYITDRAIEITDYMIDKLNGVDDEIHPA